MYILRLLKNQYLKINILMILKHILTVKSAPPLHINPVKQYTKFKVGGHVSFVVKISLHTPFCVKHNSCT